MAVKFKTPGVIAKILGVPLHRVHYIIRTRSHIQHKATAGTIRLYDLEAVAQIRHELNAVEARRSEKSTTTQRGSRR